MSKASDLLNRATCSAIVITCSDFRFKSAERAFAEAAGLRDDYDLIARPGAARSLVAPHNAAAGATMREEIDMLWKLHRFERVLLVHHMSCAAYADLVTPESERDVHAQHLRRAVAEVASLLPGVEVELYVVEPSVDGIDVTAIEA